MGAKTLAPKNPQGHGAPCGQTVSPTNASPTNVGDPGDTGLPEFTANGKPAPNRDEAGDTNPQIPTHRGWTACASLFLPRRPNHGFKTVCLP